MVDVTNKDQGCPETDSEETVADASHVAKEERCLHEA